MTFSCLLGYEETEKLMGTRKCDGGKLRMTLSPKLRLRHFQTFLALCEHGSLTSAAEALHTVQPSVSRTLRELETEVGSPLFLRTSKGISPNAQGELLRQYLAAGLSQIENGIAQLGSARTNEVVSLGMLPNVSRTLVPEAVCRFKQGHPGVTIRLYRASVPELLGLLREGKIDGLVSRLVSIEQLSGIVFEQLYEEPLVFAVRPVHPLAAKANLSVEDVNRHPVIVPLPGTIIRSELDRFLFSKGLGVFDNSIETVSYEFARRYLKIEDVVAFLPEGAIREELESGDALRLDFGAGDLNGAVGISSVANREMSLAAQSLIQVIRELAAGYQSL